MLNGGIADPPEVDAEGNAGFYAKEIMEANPRGDFYGNNDEGFRDVIPQGNNFSRSRGTKSIFFRC